MPPKILTPEDRRKLAEMPFMAIVRGIAEGAQGDRVGVYGSSETNTGVYAQSDADVGLFATGGSRAGYFDGIVEITKSLIVGSVDIVVRLASLQQQIAALQKQVADLQTSVPTNYGVPVHAPVSRPAITVTQFAPASGGEAIFEIGGSKFGGAAVKLYVVNELNNIEHVFPLGLPDGSGNIFPVSTPVPCIIGDPLRFFATDNSADPNDVTGLLWTLPVEWVVS